LPHLWALCRIEGGDPLIDRSAIPVGFDHCATVGNWAAYLFSGTAAQLTALAALPNTQLVPIVAVTKSGDVRWAELDGIISSGVRTKLNTWLSNHGQPAIPTGWTYRQVVLAIFRRLHANFDLDGFYVVAPEDAVAIKTDMAPVPGPVLWSNPSIGKAIAAEDSRPKRRRRKAVSAGD